MVIPKLWILLSYLCSLRARISLMDRNEYLSFCFYGILGFFSLEVCLLASRGGALTHGAALNKGKHSKF